MATAAATPQSMELRKVALVMDLTDVEDSGKETSRLIVGARELIFDVVDVSRGETVRAGAPAVSYLGNDDVAVATLTAHARGAGAVYNRPERPSVVDKAVMARTMAGSSFLPLTVTSPEEAASIAGPVVGKPSDGSKGVGIQWFESGEAAAAADTRFDLYCEAIPKAEEYRAYCWRDSVLRVDLRVSKNDIQGKARDARMKFRFTDTTDSVRLSEFGHILEDVRAHTSLEWLALDIMRDSRDGRLWLIEVNSGPGMGPEKLAVLYGAAYLDFYGKPLSSETVAYLKELGRDYRHIELSPGKPEVPQENMSSGAWGDNIMGYRAYRRRYRVP